MVNSTAFEGRCGQTPPSSLSGQEHSMIRACVPADRGAETKKPLGRQGQNDRQERRSGLAASSHANHCRAELGP